VDYDRRRLARLARNLSRDLVDADANERETASFVALLVAEHDRLDSGDLGLTCCLDVNAPSAHGGVVRIGPTVPRPAPFVTSGPP